MFLDKTFEKQKTGWKSHTAMERRVGPPP